MSLEQNLEEIRAGITAGRFSNEASVSQGIVLRLLHSLAWPVYDTRVVCPEYSLEGRRVDFALCHPAAKPIALIEVKQVGQSEGAERQLFEYAFHAGIPLAILTDGQEWNFFLPGEQGDYAERRVYKLDVVEREVSECVSRLNRYLEYSRMESGVAIDAAREDYRSIARQRQMEAALPTAWVQLVDEEDELLIELIADRVESLCGYKPDPDMVAFFLRESVSQRPAPGAPDLRQPRVQRRLAQRPDIASPPTSVGYVLDGKHYAARNARGVLVSTFETLTVRDPSFPQRFAALPRHGRRRRFLAKSPEDLYPGRPDLARDHSVQLKSGWWLGTNVSRAAIMRIITMACGVANIRLGRELSVNLGE